jgi:sporulation protein YlmC with PRC-barrel domain
MRSQTLWAAALAATMLVAGTPDAWAKKHERHKPVPASSAPRSSAPASSAPAAQSPSGTVPNSASAPAAAPSPAASAPNTAAAPATTPAPLPPENPSTTRNAAPPEAPSTPPNATAPTVSIDKEEVQTILGKNVRDAAGDDMGRVIDVVVDRAGQTLAAIIDFGGFLGVGSRKIAVDWKALQFSPNDPKGNTITLGLTRDQVKAAPEYKEGSPVVVLGASGGLQSMPSAHPQALEK